LALQTMYRAKRAEALDDHSWLLLDGYRWTSPLGAALDRLGPAAPSAIQPSQEIHFDQEKLELRIAPVWLNNYRIGARYLTPETFAALANVSFSPDSEFRTWQQARYAMAVFSLAMPLLAASLSGLLLGNEIRWAVLCFIAIAGYMANTAMKLFILLGEHGYLSPVAAAWSVALFLLLICAAVAALGRQLDAVRTKFFRLTAPEPGLT
jgi:lipopolysaccharide export LptBFGC system permease protein LptF